LGRLPKPVIAGIDNGHTTQLLVTVQKILQAKTYEVSDQSREAAPQFSPTRKRGVMAGRI
jgi:hypothetical protein